MGIFGGLGSVIFGPLGGAIGGAADSLLARDDAQEANSANVANARTMRQTAYQDTVQDLQAAGLNPMLAYSNGPTSGNMPPMQNKGLQAAQTTSAQSAGELAEKQKDQVTAATANTNAQTALLDAQRRKVEAEIPQVTTSTANIAQQTENLKRQLGEIDARIADLLESKTLKYNQGLTEANRRNLMDAQNELAKIQGKLANGQLTNVEAQTETQRVMTQLRKLEIPGMTNNAEFEIFTSTGKGNAVRHVGEAAKTVNSVVDIFRPF